MEGPTRRRGLSGPARVAAAAQVFVPDLATLSVSAEDGHHLSRVLRLKPGETVIAADGAGSWRRCLYVAAKGANSSAGAGVVLEADGETVHEDPPPWPVVVGFVPVKGERQELVVEKLTELGVDGIVVLCSTRQVVRWGEARAGHAMTRLRRVAREAAAQSRRAWLPSLSGPMSIAALEQAAAPARLALAHPGGAPPTRAISALAVGPEGGWDDEERTQRPLIGLACGVLRAETAAISAGCVLCALRDGMIAESQVSLK